VLYIEILLAFESLRLSEEREFILCWLRIGTNDGAVNGGGVYTESVLLCPLCRQIFSPSRCQHHLLYVFVVYNLLF
jgi:hypothetical protein